ncbi:MAG: YdeI/OmpD-associated family protein [archaeon]
MPIKQINPKSQKAWRKWLEDNHLEEDAVYLVHYKKHTGKRAMSTQEAMDEAICFGWIDTTVKRLDEDCYIQRFVRRKNGGSWSRNTSSYAERLIKDGKMSPHGLKTYKLGVKKPLIDQHIPDNPEVPLKLKQALAKNKKAKMFFDSVAPSHRKLWLRGIYRAKLEETKEKRIKEIVALCSQGKKF